MKRFILILAFASAVSSGVSSSAIVTFLASGENFPITFTFDDFTRTKVPVGSPAQVGTFGQLNIAFYSEAGTAPLTLDGLGTPNFNVNGWTQAPTVLHNITAVPGEVTSSYITLGNGIPNDSVLLEVVGWSGTATTFAEAEQDFENGTAFIGWSGSFLSGGSLGWFQPTGSSILPAAAVTGSTGFDGLVLFSVPEPSTIALGCLAAAALLAFRRRK